MSSERPSLRLIYGGRHRELVFGHTRLTVSESTTGVPDGVLLEENTSLSLSSAAPLAAVPAVGGSVIVHRGHPVELLLIVGHDGDGGFRPGWLERALEKALLESDRLQLQRVAAPLVGCIGGATLEESLATLALVLTVGRYANVRAVELVCGELAERAYATLNRYANSVRH